MLIPLSWLKEYVDIKIPFPELAAKLSGAGLTVETWKEEGSDIIFDPEVTPNRPDWLSVLGIAREIAAVTNTKLKHKELEIKIPHPKNSLPISIKSNFELVPRMTTIIIKNVRVKTSPEWLQKRIKEIGLRPINNLVDITNYVLWLYGNPLHVFDYDKIRGRQMTVDQTKGGEQFRSLDGADYTLPKNAVVIKDVGRIIDLLPIKGGENSAVSKETKNVLLHSVVVNPILTRRTSQAMGLRSDSSAISERGVDPNGSVVAVKHTLKLILDLAGGEIASDLIDHKIHDFNPWTVELKHSRLESVLGIKIDNKRVLDIFERLSLSASSASIGLYSVEIPTFRHDLKIEADLIEEVGRVYGYNNFPKTLPESAVPTAKVSYAKNYDFENEVKQTLKGAGYSEIYTYSLVPESQLINLGIEPGKTLRIDNPISRDFEYLRPCLLGNLIEALKQNLSNFSEIKLYELGKHYRGENLDKFYEDHSLTAILAGDKYYEAKGFVETLLENFGISFEITPPEEKNPINWLHPGRNAVVRSQNDYLGFIGELHPNLLAKFGLKDRATAWVIKYDLLEKLANPSKKYQPIPKYPAIYEDITLIIPDKVTYGEVVDVITKTSNLIYSVSLLDTHENNVTLRISYLDRTKNLTEKEVREVSSKFQKKLKELGVH